MIKPRLDAGEFPKEQINDAYTRLCLIYLQHPRIFSAKMKLLIRYGAKMNKVSYEEPPHLREYRRVYFNKYLRRILRAL